MTPRRYFQAPTPLEPCDRLTHALGGARIWVKRDDLCGRALGGNKVRKLEHLVADALRRGADTLITCGSVQSNHCRLTAATAARESLRCHLVLREKRPGQYDPEASGNNLLYRLLAPVVHVHPPGVDLDDAMAALATRLTEENHRPYVIPMGGSNPIGARGYVDSGDEICRQAHEQGLDLRAVVCASSSGGTQAGLAVALASTSVALHGISVDEDRDTLRAQVHDLAVRTAQPLDRAAPPLDRVRVHDDQVGPGYAQPTDEMVEAVRMFARLEGLILDPVYTGKAAAGLLSLVRRGILASGDVVFVHTGGAPALFAYPDPVASVWPG